MLAGLIMWGLVTYPLWSRYMRRLRKRAEGVSVEDAVSRNPDGIDLSRMFTPVDSDGEYAPHYSIDDTGETETGTGPAWEQIAPYPELFEEDDDEQART